ncbi:MAG: Mu transposase C-terminal domain-containing protein [Arsenophonus sp. NEOnobi-MAG3]
MAQTEHTVNRYEIPFLNNIYYAEELADEHGRKLLVSYDIHDARKVIAGATWTLFICVKHSRMAINGWPFQCDAAYHNWKDRIKEMHKRG